MRCDSNVDVPSREWSSDERGRRGAGRTQPPPPGGRCSGICCRQLGIDSVTRKRYPGTPLTLPVPWYCLARRSAMYHSLPAGAPALSVGVVIGSDPDCCVIVEARMVRLTGVAVIVALALSGSASAQAASAAPRSGQQYAVGGPATLTIPPLVAKLATKWATTAGTAAAKAAAKAFIRSGACKAVLPAKLCNLGSRPARRPSTWGLGLAVRLPNGRVPGVWNSPSSVRHQLGSPLTPGSFYYLTCWTLGQRIAGPFGATTLWYRLTNRGYVSDALLYTGTNDVVPGVRHC